MNRPRSAILLAGSIRRTPQASATNLPALCLPVGRRGLLLDAWLEALATIDDVQDVRVVLMTAQDVESVRSIAPVSASRLGGSLRLIAEPAPWRGAAGILRDVTEGIDEQTVIIACEARRLPPPNLAPLLKPFDEVGDDLCGVVGIQGRDEPGGVYALTRRCIAQVPAIGYQDLKEQFLPSMASRRAGIISVPLEGRVMPIRDRESYLRAVRASIAAANESEGHIRRAPGAFISASAVLSGCCIVEDGAIIEDGAVVHDSVILWGATVGGGAVVSRSVVGPLAAVQPRSRVMQATLIASPRQSVQPGAVHAMEEFIL